MQNKVKAISDALDLIKEGDTIAISAAGLIGYPEYLVSQLEKRYVKHRYPGDLTLIAGCGHGDPRFPEGGDSRFAHPGFLRRVIHTHTKTIPKLREMIERNELEAYILPQGILNQLYRSTASGQPCIISRIGKGTYIDPRQDGGKLNQITSEDIVSLIEIDGDKWLRYKSFPITIGLIRGTYADENGNVTIDHEALKLEILEIALAVKASGGKVIVQIEHAVEKNTLKPKDVVVPGELVDAIVEVKNPEIFHKQTDSPINNPFLSGEARCPHTNFAKTETSIEPKDVICRRAVFELNPGAVVNLGIGVGAGTGMAAAVEGIIDQLSFTVELGVFGGTPLPPPNFGASLNPGSFVSPPTMFDFYHGGGLDVAVLGAAQIDREGNVNVSKFEGHPNGQGGFIDISQSAKKVIFCTYFKAKGFKGDIFDRALRICSEGKIPKFIDKVEQITFNASVALKNNQEVYYITERGVFELGENGIVLTEIAPGIDLKKDILQQMDFEPLVSKNLKVMDKRIFTAGRMGCFDNELES